MTRGKQDKLYRTFTKGLVTEAGFLTYPEDASIDELNTVIYRKGNRSRRAGIDFEEGSTPVNFGAEVSAASITNEFLWRSPGEEGGLNFLVIQVDNKLHFFDMSASPLSSGKKPFVLDLLTYKTSTATVDDVKGNYVQMAAGKGILFICQNYIEPVVVEYDPDTGTFIPTKTYILMRDFDGVDDGYANDFEPRELTKEHHYNLLNQGWVRPSSVAGNPIPTGGSDVPETDGGSYRPRRGGVNRVRIDKVTGQEITEEL